MKHFFIILIVLLFCSSIFCQNKTADSSPPTLTVLIIIDQLNSEHLALYHDKFSDNGFNKLSGSGQVYKNAKMNYYFTEPNVGYASIVTGAYPSVHGIVSDKWYDPLSGKTIHSTKDTKCNTIGGSFEAAKHSPSQLSATTIADELKISTQKRSKAYSVSFDASLSVLSTGHIANAAYCFDEATGNWVTGSIYADSLKPWVKDINKKNSAEFYLQQTWQLLLDPVRYTSSTADNMPYETGLNGKRTFPYALKELNKNVVSSRKYAILRSTPYNSTLTKDFAISLIENEELGKDAYPDFLVVGFTAIHNIEKNFGSHSVELEDTYLRLDKDIGELVSFLEKFIGKEKILVCITSGSSLSYDTPFMQYNNLPSGYFNHSSAIFLLKSYLNITYGKAEWVKLYNNQQIYLNRTLIEDSKLSLNEVQTKVAQFMLQFSGVANVVTASSIINNNYNEGMMGRLCNNFNPGNSADIILSLKPGWSEKPIISSSPAYSFQHNANVPIIWYGQNIIPQLINREVGIIDIAPSMAHILEISPPNACSGKILDELLK